MKNNSKSFGDLVSMNENQMYPRMAKPSDFGAAPSKPEDNGEPMLWKMGENQEMPRHVEDDGAGKSGAGTPAVWGAPKGVKSMQNHSEEGTKVSGPEFVDFKDGSHSCSFGMKK